MSYLKLTKDKEGTLAEAIGTELSLLAEIDHPVKFTNGAAAEIKIKSATEVILPTYDMDSYLSDLIFDFANKKMPDDDDFLKSMGRVIAFNWYIGQDDFNITNVSVYDGKCYPFDFDCCFKNIQSAGSFAKTRTAEYHHEDLDDSISKDDIIKAAIKNLMSSIEVLGCSKDTLNYLFESDNMSKIKLGFEDQIDKITKIDASEIQEILKKHVSEKHMSEKQAHEYTTFLAIKKSQIDVMTKNATISITEDQNNFNLKH